MSAPGRYPPIGDYAFLGDCHTGALVLETEMTVAGGRVRVTDCLTMRPGGARRPYRQLLRVVDGLAGAGWRRRAGD
jgi:hypothetical protein